MAASRHLSPYQFGRDEFGRSRRTGKTEEESIAGAQKTAEGILASWKANPARDPGYTTGAHGRNRGRM